MRQYCQSSVAEAPVEASTAEAHLQKRPLPCPSPADVMQGASIPFNSRRKQARVPITSFFGAHLTTPPSPASSSPAQVLASSPVQKPVTKTVPSCRSKSLPSQTPAPLMSASAAETPGPGLQEKEPLFPGHLSCKQRPVRTLKYVIFIPCLAAPASITVLVTAVSTALTALAPWGSFFFFLAFFGRYCKGVILAF
jgi:hypothetical protein